MAKKERIDGIFNILVQFEKIGESESQVTAETYSNYLDRLTVWYMGYGNDEIVYGLKGLHELGAEASHETVRRMVFHLIDILDKEV